MGRVRLALIAASLAPISCAPILRMSGADLIPDLAILAGIKTTSKIKTYIYHGGRLHIKGAPRPYRETIDLGVAAREEPAGVEEPEVTVEAKAGGPEPIGGANHHLTPHPRGLG